MKYAAAKATTTSNQKQQHVAVDSKRSQTMVPLAYVDRDYSEKIRKLANETRMAKRAIKKMHNKLIDAEQSHQKTIG